MKKTDTIKTTTKQDKQDAHKYRLLQAERLIAASEVKVKVSQRALLARLRRALAKEGELLKTTRPRDFSTLGDYYTVNDRNCVSASHVDPETMAREMNLLKPYEEVEA